MTKLASSLPDGNGLEAVRHKLLSDPRDKHVAVAVLDCSKVTIDYEKGGREPTAAIRTIEVVHPDDLDLTQQILTRGRDRRLGATVLPIGIEDDITSAFKGRSEDYGSDLMADAAALEPAQKKVLISSLDTPLRHELASAIIALRESKHWVKLGRARRVLQIVVQHLEENDKRLLRDENGYLVDPETGDVIEEDAVTSDELDRMLDALREQQKDDEGGDEPKPDKPSNG